MMMKKTKMPIKDQLIKPVVLMLFLLAFGSLCVNAQTSAQLPEEIRKLYASTTDSIISDEFDADTLDMVNKWNRRSRGSEAITEHLDDKSLVVMETEVSGNGTETKYVSLKGYTQNGPIRTATIISRTKGDYGFYVSCFRFRGFETPEVIQKGAIWHPSIWGASGNLGEGEDWDRPEYFKTKDFWIEIDVMEWKEELNGWVSHAIATFVDSNGKRGSVLKNDGELARFITEPVQQHNTEWQTIGFEYTPDYMKLWEYADGQWRDLGERVVTFVEDDLVTPENGYTLSTIGKKSRNSQFWLLGNTVARHVMDYINAHDGKHWKHAISDLSTDFDYFRYYPYVGEENCGGDNDSIPSSAVQPFGEIEGEWELIPSLSDEFESASIDAQKWDFDPNDWGPWSWEPHNATQTAGNLNLTMEYSPHERNGQQLFYTSGIVKSYETFQYGYMEAKVKGCEKFPGVCPAFWAINSFKIDGKQIGAEIDVMEIQEVKKNVHQIDCNLHARVNGEDKKDMVHQRRHWIAPWDPRDDFHVYACEWTEDSISWYIDGVKRVTAPNEHWHIPLKVYVSMGLRPPFVVYDKRDPENPEAVNRYPAPEASTEEGFPTSMQVEYVRVWKRKQSIISKEKE